MGWQLIGKRLDKVILMVDFERSEASHDDGLHIRIDKTRVHDEFFPENIQDPITADKTYKQDTAVRYPGDERNLGVRPQYQGREAVLLEYLLGRLPLEATVAVVPVVKTLKVFRLLLQGCVARKPLPSEELPIIGIVEVLHHAVAPRLADGNEDRDDAVMQAHAQHDPQGARVTVASPEAQCVIDLQEHGNTHRFPAPHETCRHVMVFLGSLGLDIDPVTEDIHDIERIESPIALDVPGTDKVHLMHMVDGCCFGKIGIVGTFRNIGSFFS